MDVRTDLLPRLQELNGMFEFELKIMVVRIGTKANFFDHRLFGVGFYLLLLLLLLVDKFAVVNYPADRRHCFWRYFHQIQLQFIRKLQCLSRGIYPLLNIIAYQSYLGYPDVFINTMFRLLLSEWWPRTSESWSF